MWKIYGKNNQKWMVLGLVGQLFMPVGMKMFSENVWTHSRVQIGIFLVQKCPSGTYLTKDEENLGKINQKRMLLGLPGQLFKLIWIKYFRNGLDPF